MPFKNLLNIFLKNKYNVLNLICTILKAVYLSWITVIPKEDKDKLFVAAWNVKHVFGLIWADYFMDGYT